MSDHRGRALNRAELADYTGRSLPTIDAWVRAGCPYKGRGSKGKEWIFNSAAVLDWLEARAAARTTVGIPKGDLDPAQERARKDRALAEQTEMRNAERRGELVNIEEVGVVVEREFSVVRERSLSITGRLNGKLSPEQLRWVEDEIREALSDLSAGEDIEPVQQARARGAKAGKR